MQRSGEPQPDPHDEFYKSELSSSKSDLMRALFQSKMKTLLFTNPILIQVLPLYFPRRLNSKHHRSFGINYANIVFETGCSPWTME